MERMEVNGAAIEGWRRSGIISSFRELYLLYATYCCYWCPRFAPRCATYTHIICRPIIPFGGDAYAALLLVVLSQRLRSSFLPFLASPNKENFSTTIILTVAVSCFYHRCEHAIKREEKWKSAKTLLHTLKHFLGFLFFFFAAHTHIVRRNTLTYPLGSCKYIHFIIHFSAAFPTLSVSFVRFSNFIHIVLFAFRMIPSP